MIFDKVRDIIAKKLNVNVETVTLDADFKTLGADSIDIVDIVMDIEDEFKITVADDDALKIKTVGDAVAYIESKI